MFYCHVDDIWGGMVAQWLVQSPHSEKVQGSIPSWARVFLEFARSPCVDMSFLWVLQFSLPSKYVQDVYRSISRSLSAALWLPTAPHGRVKCRDQNSLYAVYETNKIPLPLWVEKQLMIQLISYSFMKTEFLLHNIYLTDAFIQMCCW